MQRLTNAQLVTLGSTTVNNLKPSDVDSLEDFLTRVNAKRAPDYKNGSGEDTISTLVSNLNGLNP